LDIRAFVEVKVKVKVEVEVEVDPSTPLRVGLRLSLPVLQFSFKREISQLVMQG
jgi:hypothetical protein